MFKKIYLYATCLLILGLALTSCKNSKEDKYEEKPVKELYDSANTNLAESKFKQAAKDYEEVLRQHPYSQYATQAQIMGAYAHYREGAYEDAIVSADAFIQLHPAHKNIAYAYFLKGLCYFNQISSDDRDQKMTENALLAFEELIKRFPVSPYTKDAKLKLALAKEHLAGSCMDVGRFYQTQRLEIAALGRFKEVIRYYETTSHVPEALYRLVEINLKLGIPHEAQAAAAILGHNYTGNKWYKKAFNLLKSNNMLPSKKEAIKLKKGWNASPDATKPLNP